MTLRSDTPKRGYADILGGAAEELGMESADDTALVADDEDEYGYGVDETESSTGEGTGGVSSDGGATGDSSTPGSGGSPADEMPAWAKSLQENVNALGGMVSQIYGGYANRENQQTQRQDAPVPQKDPRGLPDDHPLIRLEKIEKVLPYVQGIGREMHGNFKSAQAERFAAAERDVASKFGKDFDELVPPEQRQRVLQNFLADADRMDRAQLELKYGFQQMGWSSQLETLFKQRDYDRLKTKQADEVARVREKRERESKIAARVPAGGSNHQEPSKRKEPSTKRGYTDVTRDAKAHWESLMGG